MDYREELWLHHSNETYEKLYWKMSEEAKEIIEEIIALEDERNNVYWKIVNSETEYKARDTRLKEIDDEIFELDNKLTALAKQNEEDKLAEEVLTYMKLKKDEVGKILD